MKALLCGYGSNNGWTTLMSSLCIIMTISLALAGPTIAKGQQHVFVPNLPCSTNIVCDKDADCMTPCKDHGGGGCFHFFGDSYGLCCCLIWDTPPPQMKS
ncbi:hypothetical protein DM860_003701 [Cuscuta australis]|uniref:Uncharacterized protein n=1 Tax=Cuscuta australis TaxID=267555 RepID=A0A328DGL8_9ASTE|nr:hypothetical protein DM860_003701 [Cuscuta australis]